MKRRVFHFWIVLVVLLFWRVPALSAEGYRWEDSSGVVHYSPVRNMIITSASRLKVDPALVEAIIAVESGFDPRAISPKGAIGLMQLMPQTASRYGVSDPFDPQENLTGGIRYLGDLLHLFGGDLSQVLAAYNAGEAAVFKYQGIPPYRETKEYIRKVLARYRPGQVSPSLLSVERQTHEVALARVESMEDNRLPDVSQRDTSRASNGINSVSGTVQKRTTFYRPLTRLSSPPLVRMRATRTVLVKLRVHRYLRSRPFPIYSGNLRPSSSPR